jgi:putative DNA primase/helicase
MDTTKENALREQSVHFKTPSTDYSATPNIEPMFVSGFGQFHTNEPAAENPNKKLTPYVTINLPGIRALVDNPQSVDKAEGQWLIASTLPCRTFATQEQSGEFWMLWADLDLEPKPLNEVAEVLDAIIPECDREQYTSRSAQENNPKSRILIPLIKPLCGGHFLLCQDVLNDKLAERGLTPDRVTERGAGQLCYLPNCRDFYQSLSVRDGNCFDPLSEWALEIAAKRAAIAEHERVLHSEAQAAAIRREALKLDGDNPNLIGAFNAAHTVQDILLRAGYKQRGNTFRQPHSESGSYSASVKNGRVHSMSSNDPLYTSGGGVGAHDAFSAFCVLFAGGDQSAALKLAGAQWLSIGGESWNTVQQRDYMRRKAAAESHDPSGSAGAAAGDSEGTGWPEPQPLTTKIEPEPYPLDALPDTIRAAVEEVAGFVKAPIPLVAASALAALSLAIQAHADVKRADKLTGPVGLFLLTIADSGERKSTCDGFFTKAIHDYETQQAEAGQPILSDYKAAIAAWEAERDGIISAIKQAGKTAKSVAGKDIKVLRAELAEHQHHIPEAPRIPRLLYTDATPQALAYGLAHNWPAGGVVSAEAGIVFGSHGMGKDSVMLSMGQLNQLWDGNSLTIDRRTTESYTVKGARLTVALQVQEPTLREFFKQSGALARGIGFLARFLVAWPESTQGFRPFSEAPANWPHHAAFNQRIAAILGQPAPIDEHGALTPAMLTMTPDAKAAWVQYHDAIERELPSGGELYDVQDVAAKSAENAVRLAALFQMFEGSGGAVGAEAFEGAGRIAAWHLNESRRFFGELALPAELANAARLDTWLIAYCKRERTHLVPIAKLQQGGPGGLRSKAVIETALRELEDAGRARMVRDGKRKIIAVNPALVIEGGAS